MDFGVPEEVKGYVQNSNYASVMTADYIFARRVIYPKLTKVWSKFTHEMNRITGGMDCAISFDYELPVLNETRSAQVDSLIAMKNAGYTLESIVEALKLPKAFLKLVGDGQEAVVEEREDVEETNNGIDADQVETSVKSVEETKEKAVEADPKLTRVASDYMAEQIKATQDGKDFDEKENAKKLALALLAIILLSIEENGKTQHKIGMTQLLNAGYNLENVEPFYIPEEVKATYETYLNDVALSYTEDTTKAIKDVLGRADVENWTQEQLRAELGKLIDTNSWRVVRLANTETHRAEQYAKLTAMRELAKQTGAEIYKVWNINPMSPNPCEVCLELNGKKLPLGEDFGDFSAGADEVADAHPNCSCYLTFEVVEVKKSVAVCCPNCHRHLFESEGGNAKGVKCQGCKKHFDFDIIAGEVKSVEIIAEKKEA